MGASISSLSAAAPAPAHITWVTMQRDSLADERVRAVGLENPSEAHHCFLNACVQSLWHLSSFRAAFARGAPTSWKPKPPSAGNSALKC